MDEGDRSDDNATSPRVSERAKELARALPLNWDITVGAPKLKKMIHDLTDEIVDSSVYKRAPADPRGLTSAVELLVVNLLRLKYTTPGWRLAIELGKTAYAGRPVAYHNRKKAIDGLCAIGILEKVGNGYWDRNAESGRVTRFGLLERFNQLCADYGIRPSMISFRERARLVELRQRKVKKSRVNKNGAKKKYARKAHKAGRRKTANPVVLPWPRTASAERRRMVKNLRAINAALRNALIILHVPDAALDRIQNELSRKGKGRKEEQNRYIDLLDKQLYRVFNDGDPKLGGRFYGGWWQSIPRKYRKHIYIGNRKNSYPKYVAECDYSAMQPRILYAWERCDSGSDVYSIYDDPAKDAAARPVVKLLLLQMLNASDRTQAIRAARREIVDEYDEQWYLAHGHQRKRPPKHVDQMLRERGCPPLMQLVRDIEARHPMIRKYFYTGVGKQLMYVDSNIAERVMLRMLKLGAVALPVHDSFLVQRGYKWDLEKIMQEEFQAETGSAIPVKFDKTEFEYEHKDKSRVSRGLAISEEEIKREEQKRRDYGLYLSLHDDWTQELDGRSPFDGSSEGFKGSN
jgi:hypothetical protein